MLCVYIVYGPFHILVALSCDLQKLISSMVVEHNSCQKSKDMNLKELSSLVMFTTVSARFDGNL